MSPAQANNPTEETAAPAGGLPTPAERPAADIVLYDGACNFCRSGVRRLSWWDCQGHLAYVAIGDPTISHRWPDLPVQRLHEEMCIVDQRGRMHWGADAVRHLTLRLRRLWWLAPLMYLPGAMLLWRPAYRLVARNRYRLMGRTAHCETGACGVKPNR